MGSGGRRVVIARLGFTENGEEADSCVVRSVRSECRYGTSTSTSASAGQFVVSCEKQANQLDSYASRSNFVFTVIFGIVVFTCHFVETNLHTVGRCATCAMGMMGMFKWLRKDTIQRDRNDWNLAQKQNGLNNESYRNALQAFIDRRRISDDVDIEAPCSPDKKRADFLSKNNNNKSDNERNLRESKSIVPGVPHVLAPEIFEIGWVAGTEDRYLELIFAEWQNTRVSLKRHSHPECKDAVKADLDVLSEIRHPNVLLLMASTFTDDHGLVSIFESIDCTLYHYMHDQGERISIQGIAKCGGRLSDALRHSHMRGYVHSAINSHCVYLASNGVVKLGGWELAMHINSPKPEREYEERLRNEIFRWQAPELFHSYEPYKQSDVYGLALLIWEMCTMHVPWSGHSKADVERQYVHWKRGVIMDLYDFPPLLNNLLDAGLQLDINKRTLDMDRMRRFLQRLETQYEHEEPIYVDQYANNNNEAENIYILPIKKSPMKNKGPKLTKSVSTKQLSRSVISPDPSLRQHSYSRKSISKQNANQKVTPDIEEINFSADDVKGNTRNDIEKNTNTFSNLQNNYKKINHPTTNEEVSNIRNEEFNVQEISQPWNNIYRKVKAPQEATESRTTSVYSSPLLQSSDDESYKDARTNLKQLKEILANKRQCFFYGSQSSHTSPNISPTSKMLIKVKSKDYEPHKPASHKTSLEPKYSKSPNQYNPTYMKSTFQQYRKIPYLHTPEGIKGAIIQPQVLNSNPQTFFETSLWRKEKLICLSKMRKMHTDESPRYLAEQIDDSDTISTEATIKNQTEKSTESVSINNNVTYVIKKNSEETSLGGSDQVCENINNSTSVTSLQSEPLQVLKDALDRATKIVRSVTPNSNDSCPSPTFKYSCGDFEVTLGDNQAKKDIFENLYDLQNNSDDEEISDIEWSTTKDKLFLFDKSNVDNPMISNETQSESSNNNGVSLTNIENYSHSYDTTINRNFACESIAEVSNEFNASYIDTISEEKAESLDNKVTSIKENAKASETAQKSEIPVQESDVETKIEIKENEQKSAMKNLDFMNDTTKYRNCKTCHHSNLPRRRSLPATLNQLRIVNNSALGKLPIRRGDIDNTVIADNTTEDLYIDDEFGDELNINMVLLDDSLLLNEDFLSEISEL
ncbi:uncharacterized protein LOC117206431 isoform X1 [Bombus bifarius]|uniref:Uncharacterized protein LOC117206431 isoform X1 n=1 Tax=Bombus bifarius TaxID=103933 RepID=A0A6P8LME1_9HYME|nr:uncharacterized protein LOC117206431 isoform X1 [Bombus bifarius]